MNILLTGASRGIGAATLDLLNRTGHRIVGHSTKGDPSLLAADLSRLALAHFRANSGGRIVNVASRAAYRGDSPQHWHYAASKAGMVAMTKSMARAYAAEGIYAFAICPGFTASEMVEEYLASRGGPALVADIPIGRPATTAEIAEVIRWLAIDAPPSATGAVIDANGASYVR